MRKILVVIDMQNDFIDGSLGTPEAVAIVNNVRRKIESYDRNDVYATRDTHQVDYLETQEGQNLPVEHCIINLHSAVWSWPVRSRPSPCMMRMWKLNWSGCVRISVWSATP